MKSFSVPAFLAVVLVVLPLQGAGKKQFGEAADPKAGKVRLADLVAKPSAYDKKTVVIDGHYAGACGDGDYFFVDGEEVIEFVFPSDEVTSLKKGTPVRLFGTVVVHHREGGQASVGVEGRGLEVRE